MGGEGFVLTQQLPISGLWTFSKISQELAYSVVYQIILWHSSVLLYIKQYNPYYYIIVSPTVIYLIHLFQKNLFKLRTKCMFKVKSFTVFNKWNDLNATICRFKQQLQQNIKLSTSRPIWVRPVLNAVTATPAQVVSSWKWTQLRTRPVTYWRHDSPTRIEHMEHLPVLWKCVIPVLCVKTGKRM